MNGGVLQSTLRELTAIATSRRLWITFGAVVLLFTLTGPFGTLETLRFLPRLGYWLSLHLFAWSTALVFSVLGDVLLAGLLPHMLGRMMVGSIVAAAPIGLIIELVGYAWFGRMATLADITSSMLISVPLCVIFCLITYMTMAGGTLNPQGRENAALPVKNAEQEPAPTATSPRELPPLLRRLKPENRGSIRHIAVEDHYTLVKTSRGSELILLRFSDALAEIGDTSGLQVHRSHWVADDFVGEMKRVNGKLTLKLADGTEVPVSRTYTADVRSRFE